MARKKDKKKKEESAFGFDAGEADEAKEAEEIAGTEMDAGKDGRAQLDLVDRDKSTAGIETYDEDTGKLEGIVTLKDGETGGLLAQVKIIEEVKVEMDHFAEVQSLGFSGKLNIENPSEIDRLWDVDVLLSNIESTNLTSGEIHITELGVTEENNVDSRDFEISGEAKNLLLVKEYINTLLDADDKLNITDIENNLSSLSDKTVSADSLPDDEVVDDDSNDDEVVDDDTDDEMDDGGEVEASLESFAISIDKENTITFAIALRSLFDKPITDVVVTKIIPDELTNPLIADTSIGMAEIEGDQLVWTIDELEPETTVLLKFTCEVFVTEVKTINTGPITVTYTAASSFAEGLEIEQFDAYTQNGFYVDILEKDEAPGVWECQLIFENSSEFIVDLLNADVPHPEFPDEESKKLVDIDPNDVPRLPSGATWTSSPWDYESDQYPAFRKKLEFRVVPDFSTVVNGNISISDVVLAIASITGEMTYDITQVPTFAEKDVETTHTITNNGSATINEISVVHQFFDEAFQPPTLEEITITINNDAVEVGEDAYSIEENILKISLNNLKDSNYGELQADAVLEMKYPIHCMNPPQDATFESEITYLANTYPLSQEIEIKPEVPVIEALHQRRKFRIGKKVMPIGSLGQYQIALSIENIGDMELKNLTLKDLVPDLFEHTSHSIEPAKEAGEGGDILTWDIETLAETEKLEITYDIEGKPGAEYSPKAAQISL